MPLLRLLSATFAIGGLVEANAACDTASYYAGVTSSFSSQSGEELERTIQSLIKVHTFKSYGEAWEILKEADASTPTASTVLLVYKNQDWPKDDTVGNGVTSTTGWNREHTWPNSKGLLDKGSDYSDMHNLRAADMNINSARGNLPFDMCTADMGCTVPAHPEAPNDTGKNGVSFMPPVIHRGDVARSILYMATRYDGLEPDTLDLRLTDCPGLGGVNTMGKLSTLLKWHKEDPPSERERFRNDVVCKHQGNRNPFVDFPELAEKIYNSAYVDPVAGCGTGVTPQPSTASPTTSQAPTSTKAPTSTSAPSTSTLPPTTLQPSTGRLPSPGSLSVGIVAFDAALKTLSLVSLKWLPQGSAFGVTDNGYDGSALKTNEGTIKITAPLDCPPGTVFSLTGTTLTNMTFLFKNARGSYENRPATYPDGSAIDLSKVTSTKGSFALSTKGDSIIIAEFDTAGNPIPASFALTYGTDWLPAGSTVTATSQSLLPESLADRSIYINAVSGATFGSEQYGESVEAWFTHLVDPSRWTTTTGTGVASWSVSEPTAAIVGFDATSKTVAIMALTEWSGGVNICLTDNAWTGSSLKTSEGVVQYVGPVVPKGSVVVQSSSSMDWKKVSGSFAISTSGDNIHLFNCDMSSPKFFHALSFLGDWATDPLTVLSAKNSFLPPGVPSTVLSSYKASKMMSRIPFNDLFMDNTEQESNWENVAVTPVEYSGMSIDFVSAMSQPVATGSPVAPPTSKSPTSWPTTAQPSKSPTSSPTTKKLEDTDGDGVPDDLDFCSKTVIPEQPRRYLDSGNYALLTKGKLFNYTMTYVESLWYNPSVFDITLDDTHGCTCEQLISICGYGRRFAKYGCSKSAMIKWAALKRCPGGYTPDEEKDEEYRQCFLRSFEEEELEGVDTGSTGVKSSGVVALSVGVVVAFAVAGVVALKKKRENIRKSLERTAVAVNRVDALL